MGKWMIVIVAIVLAGAGLLWYSARTRQGVNPYTYGYAGPPGVQGLTPQALSPQSRTSVGPAAGKGLVGGIGAIAGAGACVASGLGAPAAPLCGAIGGYVAPYAVAGAKSVAHATASAAKSVGHALSKLNPF